jgi:hypothetical protein
VGRHLPRWDQQAAIQLSGLVLEQAAQSERVERLGQVKEQRSQAGARLAWGKLRPGSLPGAELAGAEEGEIALETSQTKSEHPCSYRQQPKEQVSELHFLSETLYYYQ